MIKISEEVVEISNVNVTSCLHPHPLIEDSYADLEEHWFSWIPGFDSTDLGDEDEEPLFRDNNIQLYERIESIAVECFNKALTNMWPLLHNYLINSIQAVLCLPLFLPERGLDAVTQMGLPTSALAEGFFVLARHLHWPSHL